MCDHNVLGSILATVLCFKSFSFVSLLTFPVPLHQWLSNIFKRLPPLNKPKHCTCVVYWNWTVTWMSVKGRSLYCAHKASWAIINNNNKNRILKSWQWIVYWLNPCLLLTANSLLCVVPLEQMWGSRLNNNLFIFPFGGRISQNEGRVSENTISKAQSNYSLTLSEARWVQSNYSNDLWECTRF